LLCLQDDSVIALASDSPLTLPRAMPHFALDDLSAITQFVLQRARHGDPT
jgi:hypothetical protein